ncbi:hypothetical protein [Dyella sp.]|jgi:hypothetical protein|uniref:hypothetical protein n=1 Tax=Dyella sp. TaxID=1869338 RepID=UPI002D79BC0D|nr:hypothetical protein [Dyella sp.]HET6432518.1 hypothetical protein [Dyella sp.]
MTSNAQDHLHEVESLTRSYARYSRSAGGVGSVLGGVLCLFSYLAGALLPLTPLVRATLIAVPALWLLSKWWLTHRFYQRFGHVEEQPAAAARRVHVAGVVVTVLVAGLVSWKRLSPVWPHLSALSAGDLGYLLVLWLLPLAAWRWLRSPLDFIVGVFLFCQAAVVSAGFAYPLIGATHDPQSTLMALIALEFPLAALAMIGLGMVEHRRYRQIERRLQQLATPA